MEKVLLVMNAKSPSVAAMDFACLLAQPTQALVTGVFLEESVKEYFPEEDFSTSSYFNATTVATTESGVIMDKEQAVQLFKEVCQQKGMVSQAYVEQGDLLQDLIYESRFADLIVIDQGIHVENEEQLPSYFIDQILAKAECPVVMAPKTFNEINKVVFLYNGSASSVFAMKQFTNLLPQFSEKPAILLEVNSSGMEYFDEGCRRVLDWLGTHYTVAHYQVVSEDDLYKSFSKQSQKLVVMGAHLGGKLSKSFKESYTGSFMPLIALPLFINTY